MTRSVRRWMAVVTCTMISACASDIVLGPGARTDNAAIFDEVWRAFDMHYSYFGIRNVDWNASRTRYRPRALAAGTGHELATVIGEMICELRDVHVVLTPTNGMQAIRFSPDGDQRSTFFSAARVDHFYLDQAKLTSGENIRYGKLDAAVGYIGIQSFRGRRWASEIDEALRAMDASAVVVDVRNNQGGDNGIAREIAGRFADRERTYGFVRLRNGPSHDDFTGHIAERVRPMGRRFHGPVVVLTNRKSMSAAEDFALAMRSIPGILVVGDTTAGASGGPIVRELPNGWTYQLSEWIAYTADREPFEGIGLAPDIAVAATAQDGEYDLALDAARALLADNLHSRNNASGGRVR